MNQASLEVALKNCSRDPIHVPGQIQGFGYLIATDPSFQKISAVSANTPNAQDLLSKPVEAFFDAEEIHVIRNALSFDTIEQQKLAAGMRTIGGIDHALSVHVKGGRAIIELLPDQGTSSSLQNARMFMADELKMEALDTYFDATTDRLRGLLGFDRVKAYQFLPDGSGEVISEARSRKAASFLGLRFPASDIPEVARRLYATTPSRLIPDVAAPNVPLLSAPDIEALDLSLAVLRGQDPVHQRYLKNMGVGGSLSIPLVVDGTLWGLLACHHEGPIQLDSSKLQAAELAGQMISLRLQHAIATRMHSHFQTTQSISARLVVADDSQLATTEYWAKMRHEMAALIPCDGILLSVDGRMNSHGDVPPLGTSQALLALGDPKSSTVFAAHNLRERLPGGTWGNTAGALVVALDGRPKLRVAFLRNATLTHVNWAGQPEKTVREEEGVLRLDPRNSFAAYMQSKDNLSDEWTTDEIAIGTALKESLTAAQVTQRSLREQRHRMGLMVRELNHRVRNVLSLVQSLSEHSRDEAKSIAAYADSLEQRIQALSGAHDLLTKADLKGAYLADILELEFRPFSSSGECYSLTGPHVALRSDACSVMALLIHELTSNAAKYGALSRPGGKVEVQWELSADGLSLTWSEHGGPEVSHPTRSGFGTSIIESAVPYELLGSAKVTFARAGLQAEFWLPGECIVELAEEDQPIEITSRARPTPDIVAKGRNALIVEDNYLVALMAKRVLSDLGFDKINMASNVQEALSFLETSEYGFCLLDINLSGRMSVQVAQRLTALATPFVFLTGYGQDGSEIIEGFEVPVLRKPLNKHSLMALIPVRDESRTSK